MSDNYILAYYQAIKDGSVNVGRWIRLWYDYIVHNIGKAFFYNPKKAKAALVFIQSFCRHHEGMLGGQLIRLELWQKALISVIFGLEDEKGARQFREIFVVIGRKSGKTLIAAAIAAYCLFLDGEYGGRIYFTAPKLDQANICYNGLFEMIKKEPSLRELSTKRRSDIYIESTNSTAKPIAFNNKKSDGLNISLGVCDEVASWQGEAGLKFYEVLKSSVGARKQPLILNITTAGYVNDGIYDELMKRATRVLLGDSKETRLAPFIYAIDDPDKWNDINELYKANPNLGVSVSVDYMLDEIAIAEGSLSKKAEFLTKYCNIKQNSSTAWLATQDVEKISGEHMELEQFRSSYAVVGVDLSRTTDLTACVCVIERNGVQNIFAQFFMPAEKLEEATARDGVPYGIYVQRGWLTLSGDNFIDYRDCEAWIKSLIERYEIYPLRVGYDRYTAQYLVQDLKAYGFLCDDVFQGYNLTPVIREFEGTLKDGKYNIGDNNLLKMHLLNTALKFENDTERVKLVKINTTGHIDGTAALMDALCMRSKYYNEIGEQLANR